MKLVDYQSYTHGYTGNMHVDVRLTFEGHDEIKLCNCSAYLGGAGQFGDVVSMANRVRGDLRAMQDSGEDFEVKQDRLDGSVDVYRKRDNALMFSMEAERIEGATWLPQYDSKVIE